MGRGTHAAFTCENAMFFAVWNKLRIRETEKMGREAQRFALTCEKTMFCAAWNQLRIRDWKKMGRETDRRHLLVKSQCLAQFEWNKISSM